MTTIKGKTSDGDTFSIPLDLEPDGFLNCNSEGFLIACKAALWDACYIPGSVTWRAYETCPDTSEDIPLPFGEY